jgi:hypothetical protein
MVCSSTVNRLRDAVRGGAATTVPTQTQNRGADYARLKLCGGGERNGIRKSKYARPREVEDGIRIKAEMQLAGFSEATKRACEPGMR